MEYEVRWSRRQKRFVWVPERGPDVVPWEAEGYTTCVSTDNKQGRLHLVVDELEEREMADGNLLIIAHQDPIIFTPPEGAVELDMADRCRVCYRRNQLDWRARDEDGSGKVEFVDTYRGQMLLTHHDHAAHLFARNRVFLHEGTAYFVNR